MKSNGAGTIPTLQSIGNNMRIAIVQPGCFGDNVNSTLMLKPLRDHFNAQIDIHTSVLYRSAFDNNPFIDRIFDYPSTGKNDALNLVNVLPNKLVNAGYNLVLNPHPMINGEKWTSLTKPELGTNLMLAWVRCLEDLGVKVPDNLQTTLMLRPEEIAKAEAFWHNCPTNGRRNILMEVAHESGQSFWNPEWTINVGKYLLNGNTNIFISRKHDGHETQELRTNAKGCVVANLHELSVRECTHIFNKCDTFICVSSGLTNACNTSGCKTTGNWFEVINSEVVASAPIRRENKHFWYDKNLAGFINYLKENGQ